MHITFLYLLRFNWEMVNFYSAVEFMFDSSLNYSRILPSLAAVQLL